MDSLVNLSANNVIQSIINSEDILGELNKLRLPNDILYQMLLKGLSKKRITVWYHIRDKPGFHVKFRTVSIGITPDPSFKFDWWKSVEIDFDPDRFIYTSYPEDNDEETKPKTVDDVGFNDYLPQYGFRIKYEKNNTLQIRQSSLKGVYSEEYLKQAKIFLLPAGSADGITTRISTRTITNSY